jgi:hypothetical protein
MRFLRSLSFFGLLVVLSATGAQAQSTPATLADQIHAIEAEHRGDVALLPRT